MMKVHVIPMLQDNFSYLIVNKKNESVAIDPVEPEKLFSKLREENLQLKGVLITHHHEDHAGGNEKLLKTMEVPVWGGDERIPALSQRVKGDGDSISVLDGIEITALKTPCHTKGSISYLVKDVDSEASKAAVFTGDTLFLGGCGRFFEGTAEEMDYSLNQVLAKLHPETLVYCGHEYTRSNLKFAAHVEPNNNVIKERINKVEMILANGSPSVPGSIKEELATNPFMRNRTSKEIQDLLESKDPILIMDKLRTLKNNF